MASNPAADEGGINYSLASMSARGQPRRRFPTECGEKRTASASDRNCGGEISPSTPTADHADHSRSGAPEVQRPRERDENPEVDCDCPMHLRYTTDRSGDCPISNVAFVRREPEAEGPS